jgi:hypothetical protein
MAAGSKFAANKLNLSLRPARAVSHFINTPRICTVSRSREPILAITLQQVGGMASENFESGTHMPVKLNPQYDSSYVSGVRKASVQLALFCEPEVKS